MTPNHQPRRDNQPVTNTNAEILALPNGWHLVTFGHAQISVAPDGLLMFPRHLSPGEVSHYLGAIAAAGELGTKIQADNQAKADANTSKGLPTRRMIVTEGPPPPGAIRLPQSTIGRPKNRQRALQPREGTK